MTTCVVGLYIPFHPQLPHGDPHAGAGAGGGTIAGLNPPPPPPAGTFRLPDPGAGMLFWAESAAGIINPIAAITIVGINFFIILTVCVIYLLITNN